MQQLNKDLPLWIDDVVQLCTQKSPKDRYQNMDEVISDLMGPKGRGGLFATFLKKLYKAH